MGFLSTIGGWISSAARVVRKVVSGVNDFLNGPSVSDEYRQVVRTLDMLPTQRRTPLGLDQELMAAALRKTQQQADEALRQIAEHQKEQAAMHQRLILRNRVMELAVQASAFDRYTNNIQLHAANLGIHLQNIRNITGLIEDVNALRFGLKRTMGVVNHMANLLNHAGIGRVEKLSGIDVEREQGAISVRAAYGAFEKTRGLLADEIQAMVDLAEQHLIDVRTVQAEASAHGTFGAQIHRMLEDRIVPQLLHTQRVGMFIQEDVARNFPMLPPPDEMPPGGHDRAAAPRRPSGMALPPLRPRGAGGAP